jgi:hypothetical protein
MTQEQLKSVMVFHLTNFNRTGRPVNEDTVFDAVLKTDDGGGTYSSATLFKAFVRYSMINEGAETEDNKNWPSNWLTMTSKSLAAKLLPE